MNGVGRFLFRCYLIAGGVIATSILTLMACTFFNHPLDFDRRAIIPSKPNPIFTRTAWWSGDVPLYGLYLNHRFDHREWIPSPVLPASGAFINLGAAVPGALAAPPPTPIPERLGFQFVHHAGSDYYYWWIVVPNYFLFPLLLWPHGLLFCRWVVRRFNNSQQIGVCRNCRYDVRAHKAGDKCPECGNVIASSAGTSA